MPASHSSLSRPSLVSYLQSAQLFANPCAVGSRLGTVAVVFACLLGSFAPGQLHAQKVAQVRLQPGNTPSSEGSPIVKLKNARGLKVTYVGPSELVAALQSGMATPTALAAADFDADGAMDVVAGYSVAGRGVLTLLRGNQDAYAPRDQRLYKKAMQGTVPAVFLPTARVFSVPEPPDLLVTGDFNGDGRKDVLVGARGGSLYLLAGNGHGNFLPPQRISLPGALTALAVNGSNDLAVGVAGGNG